ncbi:MAG: hypothetical protein QY316_03710 [Thermodesulfobacteriota bacterium]|nr:MAG: hypothetical protein QY316_03710 [Thermodesulfobacteriota bacterium]
MIKGVFWVVLLLNALALFLAFNPWLREWAAQAIVLLVLEAAFLVIIGVPVFIYHLRKGLRPKEALAASLDSVVSFLSGWV